MKFNKLILAILLLSSSTYSAYATDTGYEVELIIFEVNDSRQLESEDWSYNDMLNNAKDITLTQNTKQDSEFMELDWQNAKLTDSLERIKSNSKYNILVTKRWKQTGLDREKAYAIDITSIQESVTEINHNTETDNPGSLAVENTLLATKNMAFDNTSNIAKPAYIQGRVKLIMSRYLHFEVNLNYFQWQKNSEEPGYKSYPIVSERRMKSRETHYIDHPMVGIIVLATPYKPTEIEKQSKEVLMTYKIN